MLTADWIDVSVPLRTGMVHWPDNTPVSIERMLDIEGGDGAPSRAILRFIEAAEYGGATLLVAKGENYAY